MNWPRSLSWLSDLSVLPLNSKIEERKLYWRVSVPGLESFYWGNFLLFKDSREVQDLDECTRFFRSEFTHPEIRHLSFAWDSYSDARSLLKPFELAGFQVEQDTFMSSSKVEFPAFFDDEVVVRQIESSAEWESVCRLEAQSLQSEEKESSFDVEDFSLKRLEQHKAMVDAKLGLWFVAFVGSELVGCHGLIVRNDLARFRSVIVDPRYRRRGIAQTMIYQSVKIASQEFKWDRLVIAAAEASAAARIYQSLGFQPTETQIGVVRSSCSDVG